MAIAVRDAGYLGPMVLSENASKATVVDEIQVIPIAGLNEAVGFFSGELNIDYFTENLLAGWIPISKDITELLGAAKYRCSCST